MVWIVGGLLVLLLSGVAVRDGGVDAWEEAIFHAINGLPGWLTPPMQVVELFGALWIGPAVAIVALSFRKPRLAAAALLVTASKLVLERVVKLLVERQRPATSTPDAIARGVPIRGLAFVSGHVVLLAGLAGVVSPYLRGRWKLLPLVRGGARRLRSRVPRCTQPARRRGGDRPGPGDRRDVEPGARRSRVDADPRVEGENVP